MARTVPDPVLIIPTPWVDGREKPGARPYVAWRWLLELDTVESEKIIQFAEEHLDRAWECNANTRVCPFP